MKRLRAAMLAFACAGLLTAAAVVALAPDRATGGGKHAPAPLGEDTTRDVNRILDDISSRRIEASIRKLASFGTRNTLSSQDDPARGIGAARDWIYERVQAVGRDVRRPDDGRAAVLRPAGRRRGSPCRR